MPSSALRTFAPSHEVLKTTLKLLSRDSLEQLKQKTGCLVTRQPVFLFCYDQASNLIAIVELALEFTSSLLHLLLLQTPHPVHPPLLH